MAGMWPRKNLLPHIIEHLKQQMDIHFGIILSRSKSDTVLHYSLEPHVLKMRQSVPQISIAKKKSLWLRAATVPIPHVPSGGAGRHCNCSRLCCFKITKAAPGTYGRPAFQSNPLYRGCRSPNNQHFGPAPEHLL